MYKERSYIFKLKPKEREGASYANSRRKSVPGRVYQVKNSTCKDPKVRKKYGTEQEIEVAQVWPCLGSGKAQVGAEHLEEVNEMINK